MLLNLANWFTVGRIAVTPIVMLLPFSPSAAMRLGGFVLFLAAAISDYIDGHLARTRQQKTDLGALLDPIADKLLLVGTMVPMYLLADRFPFVTPLGEVGLHWSLVAVVLGRELFMTVFRQMAARRGLVIAAIGPAKWKTGFQFVWQGAAYCWFFAATLAANQGWLAAPAWRAFAHFNGIVGMVSMAGAVILTIYSLWLYMQRYGYVFGKGAHEPMS
ncbi:MAG: CDP-alcohol phosphatidyltransferase family protein [Gemmatimonadaceae bacterium]|nr:CDP-alcohol phosphatidyltransferase family protein [Gemmatimonadaceae bacterium]